MLQFELEDLQLKYNLFLSSRGVRSGDLAGKFHGSSLQIFQTTRHSISLHSTFIYGVFQKKSLQESSTE